MKVQANGLGIEVDVQGPATGTPLLLVMGLGMQLVGWPQPLVDALVAQGFRVIRMDNRDAGLSDGFDHLGVPNVGWAATRHMLRLPVPTAYTLDDMAKDAWAVLDALEVPAAHVCGASMGGMIAQHMAWQQPQRCKSVTVVMTTTGARHLPRPAWAVQKAMMSKPPSRRDREALIARAENLFRLIGSPAYPAPAAALRAQVSASIDRAYRPAGLARQMVAVLADGDRSRRLQAVQQPVHIIHGAADPLLPAAAARDLQRHLPGATLDLIDGMGHDLPAELLPRLAQGIATNAARA